MKKENGLKVVVDKLKLKIVATLATLTKYEAWKEQYIQNGMFQTNQATQKKKKLKNSYEE